MAGDAVFVEEARLLTELEDPCCDPPTTRGALDLAGPVVEAAAGDGLTGLSRCSFGTAGVSPIGFAIEQKEFWVAGGLEVERPFNHARD